MSRYTGAVEVVLEAAVLERAAARELIAFLETRIAELEAELASVSETADDRARRIRGLVREWAGRNTDHYSRSEWDVSMLFEKAAHYIDAIDAAEIPEINREVTRD